MKSIREMQSAGLRVTLYCHPRGGFECIVFDPCGGSPLIVSYRKTMSEAVVKAYDEWKLHQVKA